MKKFSVILLIYNSTIEKVERTIMSVIRQSMKKKDWELVIADDGSKKRLDKEIEKLLQGKNVSYKFTAHTENMGTVKNILEGLSLCDGEYIKLIGAGDALFDENVLSNVYKYMEETHVKCCFGLMRGFHYDTNNNLIQTVFRAPKDIDIYKKRNVSWKKIENNVLIYGDWISGASMFYEKETLEQYLKKAQNDVKYCEDIITANLVLDKEKIGFINKTLIWYEIGEGITTVDENDNFFLKLIYKDHDNYFKYLAKMYPESYKVKHGIRFMKYNRKRGIKNSIEKNIVEPRRIFYIVRINIQKIRNVHQDQNIGFLERKS